MAQPANTNQYSQSLLSWVKNRLNILIGVDDFAPLLLSANDTDLENYCNEILGTNSTTKSFINELIAKRNQEIRNKKPNNKKNNNNNRAANRRARNNKKNKNKNKNKQNDSNTMTLDTNKHNLISKKQPISSKKMPKTQTTHYRDSKSMTITHAPISKKSNRSQSKKKNKQKKRIACGCQATLHDVFKNCTQCGNILCMIEGEGPCFYCSAFVTLAGSIPNVSNASATFQHTKSEEYQAAVRQKDKLLRFGRDKIAQTTIIDDQGDFYETEANNLWLTQKERALAKQKAAQQENKMNESRADKAIEISINFGQGNEVNINEINDGRKQYIFDSIDREKEMEMKRKRMEQECTENIGINRQSMYHNSSLTGNASKIYASLQKMIDFEKEKAKNIQNENGNKNKNKQELENSNAKNGECAVNKLKDKFIQEANSDVEDEDEKKAVLYLSKKQQNKNFAKKLKKKSRYNDKSDHGVCLSMHQPWASLLVLGIKKVEGRSWSTQYRGRLWIASARREPTPFEIDQVEQEYCCVYNKDKNQIPFPKEYPTTALLGCVDVVNCLANEEYQERYIKNGLSDENNSSAHCFICENPRKLILPGAISGEHKLWKMPFERIKSMQSGLIPCDLSWQMVSNNNSYNKVLDNDDDDDERLQKVIADSLQQQ